MKVVSFEYLGEVDGYHLGEVETVTGLFFKKKSKRKVFKTELFWRFTDTGEYTPNKEVENLHRSWCAQQKLKKLENDN